MEIFTPMTKEELLQTKAYTAFCNPAADSNASKLMMHMMWRSKQAMDTSLTLPRDLFGPLPDTLKNETEKNPELHASLTCIQILLSISGKDAVQPDTSFETRDKTRLLSASAYAKEIHKVYPELGQHYTNNLGRCKQSVDKNTKENLTTFQENTQPLVSPSFSVSQEEVEELYQDGNDAQPSYNTQPKHTLPLIKKNFKKQETAPRGRSETYYYKAQRGFEAR